MSGHSKWSKVKHQKAVTDAAKGKLFTKAAQVIAIAVREGAGVTDSAGNFKLRLAIDKARAVNMPKDTIDRAIARAALGVTSGGIESIMYEGFGPGGTALIIEVTTDNRQRAVSAVRNVLENAGGSLGGAGSAQYLFDPVGIIVASKGTLTFDDMLAAALEAGAMDCVEETDGFVLFTSLQTLFAVKSSLEAAGVGIERADVVYRPKSTLAILDADRVKIETLVENLEDLEDVQRVFTNVSE